MNTATQTLVILAASLLSLASVAALYQMLLKKKTPFLPGRWGKLENVAEFLLEEWAYKAVLAAYRTSELAMDEWGERMKGWDKKVLADKIYSLIPDTIAGIPTELLKKLVTQERFEVMVQMVFDEFVDFYDKESGRFSELMQDWRENMIAVAKEEATYQ